MSVVRRNDFLIDVFVREENRYLRLMIEDLSQSSKHIEIIDLQSMDGLIEFTLEFYRLNDENELSIPRQISNMQQNQTPEEEKQNNSSRHSLTKITHCSSSCRTCVWSNETIRSVNIFITRIEIRQTFS